MNIRRFGVPHYTYNDYKKWSDDWELVEGFPYQLSPSASPKHSRAQGDLIYQAKHSLQKNAENCNCVLFVKLDWKINEETVLRPDIMIVCGAPKEDYLNFPPVLVVEILSPATMQYDRAVKFQIYQEQGVKFYLMADPLKKTVEVYELIDNQYKEVKKSQLEIDKNCVVDFDFDALWKFNTKDFQG